MSFQDDTPEPGTFPETYPANPPVNLLRESALLFPKNLFVFEGIDGSGKSTVLHEVTKVLLSHNMEVTTSKLAGSELLRHAMERAKWLNVDPVCFNLLNWVSIFHQTAAQREFYGKNRLIFFDRFTLSVRVRGCLEGLALDYMDILERMLPRPALTFLIDCPPMICLERIRSRRRAISYYESGVRHVSRISDPMIEKGEWQRRNDHSREKELMCSLERMREHYLQIAANRADVYVVDNSDKIESSVKAVIKQLIHIEDGDRIKDLALPARS